MYENVFFNSRGGNTNGNAKSRWKWKIKFWWVRWGNSANSARLSPFSAFFILLEFRILDADWEDTISQNRSASFWTPEGFSRRKGWAPRSSTPEANTILSTSTFELGNVKGICTLRISLSFLSLRFNKISKKCCTPLRTTVENLEMFRLPVADLFNLNKINNWN